MIVREKSSVPRKVKPDAAVSSEKGDKWGNAEDLKLLNGFTRKC